MKTLIFSSLLLVTSTAFAGLSIDQNYQNVQLKAAVKTSVFTAKKSTQGKKLAAGMGFGAGVPYLCTGTKYECGLTGDPSDATPVTNIDTGLRDIVKASSIFALDSSGNLYRRQKSKWDTRPNGNVGESVNLVILPSDYYVVGTNSGPQDLKNTLIGFYCKTQPVDDAVNNYNPNFGYCTPPANLTTNDWEFVDSNVTDFFGGYYIGIDVGGRVGYIKNGNAYVWSYDVNFANNGTRNPNIITASEPIKFVSNFGFMMYSDSSVFSGNGYSLDGFSSNCSISGGFVQSDCNFTNNAVFVDSIPSNNIIAEIDNGLTYLCFSQPNGSRNSIVRYCGNNFPLFTQTLSTSAIAEILANNNGYTYIVKLGKTNITDATTSFMVNIPGTGNIKNVWGNSPNNGVLNYVYIQTTTGETWRMASDTGTWTKL